MKLFKLGSISAKLFLLVVLSVVPALVILLYTGLEYRRHAVDDAEEGLLLLTNSMARDQQDVANATRQILSTLALLPEVRTFDLPACREIFSEVLEQNPIYLNLTLTDLDGRVLVAGRTFAETNLADRKHVREALTTRDFAVGEYILSRVGQQVPAFAFAYPVQGEKHELKGVLTSAIRLGSLSRYHELLTLPKKSFVAVTDHNGLRLFYYPPQQETNPVGQPIRKETWELASRAVDPGVFTGQGSDGLRRILAFEQVRLTSDAAPYMYVWAGLPEAAVLRPANAMLARNLLLMLLAALASLGVSWIIARATLISPIRQLVSLTGALADGRFDARSGLEGAPGEIGTLADAFGAMAETLNASQQSLRENEARFRLIMDSLDAIVYVADMQTYEVLFINAYGQKVLGDVVGTTCWQTIQKGQEGPCPFCTNRHLLDAAGQPGGIYTWEFQNTVTGQWFFIHDRAIEWIDKRIVRLEIATDITSRKFAEERLAEERERLAVTLKSIGDGVITTDTAGRIVLLNQVAEALTGWSSEEAAGRPLTDVFRIVDRATREPCVNPAEKVLDAGTMVGLTEQTVLIARDGREKIVADSGAPIRHRDGRVLGVVLVFRDITEELRTEQELVKVKKLESVGVLAGGIAHDFNNILSAILGNLDLALLDQQVHDKTRRRLEDAVKASYRARDLTRQLLTFAKGGQPIRETASLGEVVRDSADFVLRGTKVACQYAIPADLWLVDIDKSQISQVVQNVILNASSAMPGGGVIEVRCDNVATSGGPDAGPREGDCVRLCISDTGVGIPAELLERIFDPYFTTKKQGSGLGLAIAHAIVSKHGGRIEVDSEVGVGTTFAIFLPASACQTLPPAPEGEVPQESPRARVLVMDDEEPVRTVTSAMLRELGHDVLLARDGREAVRIYREQQAQDAPVDLVIMDLTVPGGMGGLEAVKELLALDEQARVVVSSGYSHDPVMANFRDYGFISALAKPFQLHELTRVLGEVLDSSPASR